MAKDKPSFLQNIGDDAEEQELLDALTPQEKGAEKPPEPVEGEPEKKTEEKPVEAEPASEEEKVEGKTEEPEKDEKPEKEEKKEEVKEENKEPEKKPELVFGKYKSIEEAEKGYKELESAFGRVNALLTSYKNGQIPKDSKVAQDFKKFYESPMINVRPPKAEFYQRDDGTFDVDTYMRDFSRELVMGIQRSMIVGPLSATFFDIIKQATLEEHGQQTAANKKEQEAQEITDKLYGEFPILKTDKTIEDLVSDAIYGANFRRRTEAEKEGKEPEPLSYEDYVAIVRNVLGNRGSVANQPVEPVEKMSGTPSLTVGQPQKTDEMDDIIAGMEKAGVKGQLF